MTRLLRQLFLFLALKGAFGSICDPPCVVGEDSIMDQKEHGTSHCPVQETLRWNVDWSTADRICNFNRRYAERSGSWESTTFLANENGQETVTFYDSNSGSALFHIEPSRWDDFIEESRRHGWPSFRMQDVHWEYVRVLANGETVSTFGTHLGHNLPDAKGARFCINLVSIAGNPIEQSN